MYVIATNIIIGTNIFLSIFAGEKILKIPFIAINDETAATMNLATAIDELQLQFHRLNNCLIHKFEYHSCYN